MKIKDENDTGQSVNVDPLVIRNEIVKFFDAMIAEFQNVSDNGVDPILDKYTVDMGLRPFMQFYVKRFL